MLLRYLIFFLLLTFNALSQVRTIRVKKEEAPAKKPFVTIAGVQNGEVSLTKLCSDRKFRIFNNSDSLLVEFGIIKFISADGNLTEWVNANDSLNTTFINYLLGPLSAPKTKVTIYNLKGKNKKGKEIKLNDIAITIVK
jgi:hypothetical protein